MKKALLIQVLFAAMLPGMTAAAGNDEKPYWNYRTHLMPLRLPPAPSGTVPTYVDADKDGRPDAIMTMTAGNIPVLWLDDDGDMRPGDTEGDMDNDCLLIDRNRDGEFGSWGDLIIDWVDEDGDGKADMQIIVEYKGKDNPGGAHYMIIRDLDRDNIFNYINYNDFSLRCWDHVGLSDFYEDYAGQTMFMKMHAPTTSQADLSVNWENPFLFYDPDNDGLTEMAIRVVDSPRRNREDSLAGYTGPQYSGRADWISYAVDLDNDNRTGNEFDFDLTLGFQGPGFDYSDCRHEVRNLRGNPAHDKYFLDPRYRKLTHLVYANHNQAPRKIFGEGKWTRVNFVYDEDDDNGRWERVEFYEPRDPFKSGWKNGGVDNHKQSDASGDRGEWDMDNSGKGRLYLSRFDGRLHLAGAETGVWRIDQNAQYYEGWDRMWMGQDFYPKSFATVSYADRDGNGFIDFISYDLDGDKVYEDSVSFADLGIDDRCEPIDISGYSYKDWQTLSKRMSDGIWKRAQKACEIARQYGLNPDWYAKWMTARSDRERYNSGYWLAFYIYKDLEHLFKSRGDNEAVADLRRAYYGGDWSKIATRGEQGFYFFSPEDITTIKTVARTPRGKKVIAELKKAISEHRRHELKLKDEPGGHFHDYFCPVHNLLFTFDWDSPKAHLCTACGKRWSGNARYDHAWVHQVHSRNKDYLYNCMYVYLATGDRRYADYIREMFLDYASLYDGWFEHNSGFVATDQHSGKAFAQSLDEANWATKIAMAYTAVRPLLTAAERDSIERGYLRPALGLLQRRPAGANWQMWHNSGMVALAIALEDDKAIDIALNDRERGYHALNKKHKNADGWINEGSPHYHYYPLEALIFTANAVRCRGINLFDTDLHNMFVMPIRGTYPDLSFPAHSDGWYGANLLSQTALYEIADARYNDATLGDALQLCYGGKKRLDPESLLNPRETKAVKSGKYLQKGFSFPQSGFCLLRSGERTVVLKFGGEGIGHGHPDKLSLTIHDGERELISDFGTSGYSTPDYLQWYKRTLSHNTVTVDGRDQRRSVGRLLSFNPREDGGSAEMQTLTAYPGIDMRRSIDLSGRQMKDRFTCTSDSEHVYEYVLIFNDRPVIAGDTHEVKDWSKEAPYCRIFDPVGHQFVNGMTLTTPDINVTLSVGDGEVTDMIVGHAAGVPSNPTVKDGAAAGDVAAKDCYPMILRVRGRNLDVKADWEMRR